MHPVSDGFLLAIAGIAATLAGLLLLGAFFYVETGLRRAAAVAPHGGPFLRATTKLTLLLYSVVLGITLGLVVLRPLPLAIAYAILGLALLRSLVEWSLRYRDLRRVLPIPWDSPWITWPAVLVLLALPWVMDGWEPSREAMTWTVLGIGALAVMSTVSLVLTSFDLAQWEEKAGSESNRVEGANDEVRGSEGAGAGRDLGTQGVRRTDRT